MKNRYSGVDIVAIVNELQSLVGMRVNQVYDVDTKTYLLKLNRYEEKVTLLLESGIRIHTTDYEWPKSLAPSGFSMKLRKHIKNKRLEKISQLGTDRILNLQFGINEAAYHLILELYDRGNLVLADYQYCILNILRPRTDKEHVKFVVRERYPVENATQEEDEEVMLRRIEDVLNASRPGDSLRKILLSETNFGPALVDHILHKHEISKNASIGTSFNMSDLFNGLKSAREIVEKLSKGPCTGYVIQKEEKNTVGGKKFMSNTEFHPYLFQQHESLPYISFPSFNKAVDAFFSGMESQKIESKTHQKEREAMKKLDNVKKDHEKRLNKLFEEQAEDVHKAELIEANVEMVENAITIIRSAIANQISWSDISDLIQEAQAENDPIAKVIKKLKLEINHFTMLLSNPFDSEEDAKPVLVDIDLDLTAYGNARKYYDRKRYHAKKEQKTLEASEKAFKNAEKKTKQTLKEVAVISMITKARKPMWFEKFNWFISSENYLVIAGRDIPQNEVIVKRYMKPNDIYVHADIHGASSVIIKNPLKREVPPKTLNEAGTLAVCNSAAWNAKVLTSAWWVFAHQVSKTAPTGEYLTTGSFMIRGKKNYLLPSHLILGFGFLFKLDEDSMERHFSERRVRAESDSDIMPQIEEEENIVLEEGESSNEEEEEECVQRTENGEKSSECMKLDTESEHDKASDVAFPDTKVQLPILNRGLSQDDSIPSSKVVETDTATVIISSCKKTFNTRPNLKKAEVTDAQVDNKGKDKSGHIKRGQKSKLKKIKEKYKDQDDEERELRMQILASARSAKPDKKKKSKDKGSKVSTSSNPVKKPPVPQNIVHIVNTEIQDTPIADKKESEEEEDDDEEDLEETASNNDANLLNSLTGQPVPEDGILFAVPVCAPYNSIQNYKYKVKVMPGTGRRGKAAKTALNIFLHDKHGSQREKDCLRSVKDQDISRNFPGKVKLSHSYGKNK